MAPMIVLQAGSNRIAIFAPFIMLIFYLALIYYIVYLVALRPKRKRVERITKLSQQAGLPSLMIHKLIHDSRRLKELRPMLKNEDATLEYLRQYKEQEEFKQSPTPHPHIPPEKQQAAIYSKEVIERQVVVVRCKFCNNLYPVETLKCPHCGGQ